MARNRRDRLYRAMARNSAVLWAYFPGAAMIATLWIIYGVQAVFGVDIVPHSNGTNLHPSAGLYLVIATVGTIIILAWSVHKAGKVRALATRGVVTTGTVESISLITSSSGMSPITIAYMVGEKRRKVRIDLLRKEYAVGQTVKVRYDPENPRDCDVV